MDLEKVHNCTLTSTFMIVYFVCFFFKKNETISGNGSQIVLQFGQNIFPFQEGMPENFVCIYKWTQLSNILLTIWKLGHTVIIFLSFIFLSQIQFLIQKEKYI